MGWERRGGVVWSGVPAGSSPPVLGPVAVSVTLALGPVHCRCSGGWRAPQGVGSPAQKRGRRRMRLRGPSQAPRLQAEAGRGGYMRG